MSGVQPITQKFLRSRILRNKPGCKLELTKNFISRNNISVLKENEKSLSLIRNEFCNIEKNPNILFFNKVAKKNHSITSSTVLIRCGSHCQQDLSLCRLS